MHGNSNQEMKMNLFGATKLHYKRNYIVSITVGLSRMKFCHAKGGLYTVAGPNLVHVKMLPPP